MAAQWASPKKGITDDRGTTIGGMLRLVQLFLPAAILVENVTGFLSGSNNAAPMITEAFGKINDAHHTNYRLHSWIIDAADYGVPQHRRRAILMAVRDAITLPATLPTTHTDDHRTAWDALGELSEITPHRLVATTLNSYRASRRGTTTST